MPTTPNRPHSLSELFWSFAWLALQGFGGVLAVVQRELVEKKQWLTKEEFVQEWAVAQIMPGPNVVNLSLMIGDRYFGFRGAMAALAGMLLFPLLIALTLVALYANVATLPAVQGALRGMAAVAAGLISATGLKLLSSIRHNVMGTLVCTALVVATFIAVAVLRIKLLWILLAFGLAACAWSYYQIGKIADKAASLNPTAPSKPNE